MTLPWRVKSWDGGAWVNTEVRKWNGSEMVTADAYYWDGANWVLMTDRTPPTTTQVKQYTVAWRRTWTNGGSTIRNDSNGNTRNYQGNSGETSLQCSAWGLPTTLHTDIDGAVAYYYAQVHITNLHTWYADGGTAVIGTTAVTAAPATFNSNRNGIVTPFFERGQAKWVNLGTQFCGWADDGTFYGLTLYINSADVEYYGYYTTGITYEHSYEK